jgi:hypothetical protein
MTRGANACSTTGTVELPINSPVMIHDDDSDVWPELVGVVGTIIGRTESIDGRPLAVIYWGKGFKRNGNWAYSNVRICEESVVDKVLKKYLD